ncbi:MAG: arylsulfatase [Planctomycetota bacterium]|nr:arylsulfatase [Planctomycetota bacterium]
MKRILIATAAVSLLLGSACAMCRAAEDRLSPPNIVLILCDDLGWSDVGCYGGEIRTPNVDRLAVEGVLFTRFYNNAKCTTTRASLLTGLYPRRDGPLLGEETATVAEVLKAAGYSTALSGKWHLGSTAPRRPIDRGFDVFRGLLDGCCNYFDPSRPDPDFKGGRVRVYAEGERRIEEFPEGFYTTDDFTEHAVATIRSFARANEPFFVHLCYTAPHYPLHAPPGDIARYEGRYDRGWEALREERHLRQLALGLVDPRWDLPPLERETKPWAGGSDSEWQADRMEVYAAMVDRMDQGIGRVLDALEEEGVAGDTLVIFLSDNGGCAETPGGEDPARTPGPMEHYTTCGPGWAFAQNTPFRRYKAWVHEGGIATPLVARWPAEIEAGSRSDTVGHVIDLLPTLAELAGAPLPDRRGETVLPPVEGRSLAGVLRGASQEARGPLFWEWAGNRAVRERDTKLVWDRRRKRWELYDLAVDRTEMHDRAAEVPERVERLASLWMRWARQTGVPTD